MPGAAVLVARAGHGQRVSPGWSSSGGDLQQQLELSASQLEARDSSRVGPPCWAPSGDSSRGCGSLHVRGPVPSSAGRRCRAGADVSVTAQLSIYFSPASRPENLEACLQAKATKALKIRASLPWKRGLGCSPHPCRDSGDCSALPSPSLRAALSIPQ